jgi:transcriptional regulator GlxA family with amidase domain
LGFAPSVDFRRPEAEALRRLVLFVAHELSASERPLSSLVAAELEQALMVSFLLGSTNNCGDLLVTRAPGTAPWQVRRAEEYIEANWDQPITIEALALVTDASARSLFYSFRKSRGYSPMAFVKRTRLRHARQMLESPGSDTVTGIAFDCGFANPSHFASDYLRSFGEHPSDTLRRARGGPGRTNRDVG